MVIVSMIEEQYKLATQEYPCHLQQPLTETLVLLHGWGSASNAWQPLLPALQNMANVISIDLPGFGESPQIPEFTLEAVAELIAAVLPEKCVLIGWSLGGMIAVQLAARYPQKISRVITLAANAKFVASRDYETAMPLAVNRQFNKSFATDPVATLKLFSGLLAQGDAQERILLKQVRAFAIPGSINPNWLQSLELLARIDNREAFASLVQPGLHLLAEKDVLVPASAAQSLTALNTNQQVILISGAAHALHWSQPEAIEKKLKEFLLLPALDKKQVAHSFSRAATTYDSVASLQRMVGSELLKKINPSQSAEVVVDLGCGTGYFVPRLQEQFLQALIVGVDIAEGMLRFAREQQANQFSWSCSDAESLPFADQSIDIIYSNFALQWCLDLLRLFAELQRVLKPGGELIFTTLGPETLHELKSAWMQADNFVHVNKFHERETLLGDLENNGFVDIELEHKPVVMEFEHLSDLTRSLKALGAQNVNRGRATGLTGRKTIQAFKQAYENFRCNTMLPATYDVFYIKAKKQ